jgi:hypothetical protein
MLSISDRVRMLVCDMEISLRSISGFRFQVQGFRFYVFNLKL